MQRVAEIPAHLREFVVRQDYDSYTEEDQAVWRFVVMQTHARLLRTAHPAYESGFAATGISVDRIPRIEEMSDRLERFGWRAVCVDGFIPPRAFQAFQARGILPIAADIRTSRHLTYTPAPDVIHEAAGHAPFLAEPHYAHYVRRIGAVAEKAFASRADEEVYEAIHALSELKEDPASTEAEIARAEGALAEATAAGGMVSEAARVARLYWWTAEYGLVGTPTDYRLYGAGLLSSIGEGHFCHDPGVRKIPLDASCVTVDYDITRAQPQLFVARDLTQLEDVLDEVERTLAFRVGGQVALEAALRSDEVATLELDSGTQISGVVSHVLRQGAEPILVELSGPCVLGRDDTVLDGMPRPSGYVLPLGALDDGTPLSALTSDALGSRTNRVGRLELRLKSGLTIRGHACCLSPAGGPPGILLLEDVELEQDGRVLLRQAAPFPLALGHHVVTASAGALTGFHAPTPPSTSSVPRARRFDSAQRRLIGLYERATNAWQQLGARDAGRELEYIARLVDESFPHEWLLRWNLLESLLKLGDRMGIEGSATAARLEAQLERLEIHFDRREPIATGLSYLRSLAAGSDPHARAG